MNSSCIDFIMFSPDEENMSRRPWKRERSSISTHLNEDEELASCLVLLSKSNSGDAHGHDKSKTAKKQKPAQQVFQCKACKKVFASHQALGGHRASHKKVKGCFASQDKEEEEEDEYKEDDDDDDEDEEREDKHDQESMATRKRSNAHECTVCHRVFSSGQALGGHKRCHWLTPSSYLRMTSLHDQQPSLDLNLACREYSADPAVSLGSDGGGVDTFHNATSPSWLKLASGD